MSTQQPYSGKVTVLSSGELQYPVGAPTSVAAGGSGTAAATAAAAAAAAAAADNKNPRRKVGTTFERSFAEPPKQAGSGGGGGGGRQVLKAGKPVSSAPAAPQRPMTSLELEFAKRTEQDQRWLLSFPLALKQLYFGFAESPNHDQILGSLINRFPELLAGSEQHPSPIQVAIEKGNWAPAIRFVNACAGNQHNRLLRRECGIERRTYLTLAIERAAAGAGAGTADDEAARRLICALAKACPELLTVADADGRNPMHHCAQRCPDQLLLPLLSDLSAACREDGASPELARRLGDALAAGDASGRRPVEAATTAASAAGREALARLQLELQRMQPTTTRDVDQPMPDADADADADAADGRTGVGARDGICAALEARGKSVEFVRCLTQRLGSRDFRLSLLPTLQNPVQTALDWLKESNRAELKQILAGIGQADLCHLVDRM